MTEPFTFMREFAGLCSLKDAMTGEDFFLAVKETLASWELDLETQWQVWQTTVTKICTSLRPASKPSVKDILTPLDSTHLRKQALPVMNFRKSKFCAGLNAHRLHPTLRATSVFISHSLGAQGHPTSGITVKSVTTFKTSLFGRFRRTFYLYQPTTTLFF